MTLRRVGFRNATLVNARGKILAYVDRIAFGSHSIGLSGVTFAPSVFPQLLRGRLPEVTVITAGRPRARLTGLTLSMPSGEQRMPEGGWACDAAVGSFRGLMLGAVSDAALRRRSKTPRRTA